MQVSSAHRLDVSALAVDPRGRFVATGSLDALVKLWGVVPRSAPRRLLQDAVPPHQAFSGHSSAVSGECCRDPCLRSKEVGHSRQCRCTV